MIYYFTGTGNSLDVAKRLAALLDDTVQLMDIHEAQPVIESAPSIGFVVPVHNFDIPDAVKDWFRRARFSGSCGQTYFYGLITYGGAEGNARASLRRACSKKGWDLVFNTMVMVPDNAGPIIRRPYDLTSLYTLDERLARIAEAVKGRRRSHEEEPYSYKMALKTELSKLYLDSPIVAMKIDHHRCIRCRLCERLCPVENMYFKEKKKKKEHVLANMVDSHESSDLSTTNAAMEAKTSKPHKGKMKLHGHCIHCLACIHWCPTGAIRMGYIDFMNRQYTNPYIKVQELLKR